MLIKILKDFKEQKGRTYLYAYVFKILIRCEVNNANKSISVTDLTCVPLSCVLYHLEVVRNATLFLNTLKSATTFSVHLCFLDRLSSQPAFARLLGKQSSRRRNLVPKYDQYRRR